MNPLLDPADLLQLRSLKSVALAGGDRGRLYDQGTLDVIAQVERQGHYVRNPICDLLLLMPTQQRANSHALTPEELAQGQRFLAEHAWTLEQGRQYANGVQGAESIFSHLRRDEDQ